MSASATVSLTRAALVEAPDELIKEFAEQCDLVITGSGD